MSCSSDFALNPSDTEQAITIYKQGMRKESKAEYQEAVKLYKKAMRIVPEIDLIIRRMANSNLLDDIEEESDDSDQDTSDMTFRPMISTRQLVSISNQASSSTPNTFSSTLVEKFRQDLFNEPRFIAFNPETQDSGMHISCLPNDIILRIFRWLVGYHLDIRALEQVSMVCKGFYLLSRDERLWQRIAKRFWKLQTPSSFDGSRSAQSRSSSCSGSRSSRSHRSLSSYMSKHARLYRIALTTKPPHGTLKWEPDSKFQKEVSKPLLREPPLFSSSESEEEGIQSRKLLLNPSNFGPYYTWRDLVLHHPHLHFNGVYVCQIDYGHLGGMRLDLQPMDTVCFNIRYYRVMKFHLEHRRVYMVTSAAQPREIVKLLQHLDLAYASSVLNDGKGSKEDTNLSIDASVKSGHYEWTNHNQVICRFSNKSSGNASQCDDAGKSEMSTSRRGLNRIDTNATEIELVATFRVSSTKAKLHNVLTWNEYSFIKRSIHSGMVLDSSKLDLNSEHFRPMIFSRVKCYTDSVDDLPL